MLLFRIIRPEQLARPEGFRNLLDFITVLRTPTSRRSCRASGRHQVIMNWLLRVGDPLPIAAALDDGRRVRDPRRLLHRELFAGGLHQGAGGRRAVRAGRQLERTVRDC